jgi:hypothetical protein
MVGVRVGDAGGNVVGAAVRAAMSCLYLEAGRRIVASRGR